jgi:hypothetical protein
MYKGATISPDPAQTPSDTSPLPSNLASFGQQQWVLRDPDNRRSSVDIRLSVPFLSRRFYFSVRAGRERRAPARLIAERKKHPLRTAGNLLFIVAGVMVFYLLFLCVFLLYASVISP